MNASTLFSVPSTFPVSEEQVKLRRREKIFNSPITWGSILASLVLGMFARGGPVACVVLMVLVTAALHWYWTSRGSALDEECRKDLIRESNESQDRELMRICRRLAIDGDREYANCLERFLILKKEIEGEIHKPGHLAGFAMEVDKAVDGICTEVCRELTKLCVGQHRLCEVLLSGDEVCLNALDEERGVSHKAIQKAYKTLCQTRSEILELDPIAEVRDPFGEEKALPEWVDELRREADVMGKTRERIRESVGVAQSSVSAVG